MGATLTRTPAPVLDDRLTQHRTNLRTGRRELWQFGTLDGTWIVERVEDTGTPWEVTHRPTGMTAQFGQESDALQYIARPGTLVHLRALADDVVRRGGRTDTITMRVVAGRLARVDEPADVVADRLGLAVRALAVLDGLLSPGTPDAVCLCGAYLTGEAHADACRECIGEPLEGRRRCPLAGRHTACVRPDPVQCDHLQCRRAAVPAGGGVCWRGRDRCCGCCRE